VTESLLLRVDDPANLAALVEFLAQTAYDAHNVDESTLEVELPDEVDRAFVEAEFGVYLRLWERRNPGVGATIAS